jgi:ATP-dependent helicase YprA (DUF1998 family)
MKLSDLHSKQTFALLKFSNSKERLEELRDGMLYMNNFQYFVEREKQTGIKGVGDQYEVASVMNNVNLKFIDHETGEHVFSVEGAQILYRRDEVLDMHVFCMFALDTDMMQVVQHGEGFVEAKFAIPDEQLNELEGVFGKYVLVTFIDHFMNRVEKSFAEQNIHFLAEKVKYSDFSVNIEERVRSFVEDRTDMFFWKDNYFRNQNEFRIVVLNRQSKHPYKAKIKNIQDISFIVETNKLNDLGARLEFRDTDDEEY